MLVLYLVIILNQYYPTITITRIVLLQVQLSTLTKMIDKLYINDIVLGTSHSLFISDRAQQGFYLNKNGIAWS